MGFDIEIQSDRENAEMLKNSQPDATRFTFSEVFSKSNNGSHYSYSGTLSNERNCEMKQFRRLNPRSLNEP